MDACPRNTPPTTACIGRPMVDASASTCRWQVAYPRNGQIYWWDYPDDVNDNLEQAYELAKHGGGGCIRWEYKWGPRWPRLPPGSVELGGP